MAATTTSAATFSTDESDLGTMIGLRPLLSTVWRRRRVWLLTGLVGLIVGSCLHLAVPRKYTAVTDLYLSAPAGTDQAQAMLNDVALLQTEVVAQKAVSDGHLNMTPHSLLSHYTGTSLSNNILSIGFSAPSQAEAVSGASAVARAFLAVEAKESALQSDALVSGLKSQISSFNSQIDDLNAKIGSLSGAAATTESSSQLANLSNQRLAEQSQLAQLQAQLNEALVNDQLANRSNGVLDPAAVVPVSAKRVILMDGLSGLVAGLAIGLVAVTFGALLSERGVDRSTVAATLGAPVELSLDRYPSPRLMRRRRLSRRLRSPSPSLRMIERRLRGHLEAAPGSALAVIAVGTPDPTALAVGSLALALASDGHQVVLVDVADNRPLASILGFGTTLEVMETFQLPPTTGPEVRVLVAPEDPLQMAVKPPPNDADALLVLASLDPGFGAEHLSPWVKDAVMIVSSRRTSVADLRVSKDMLREAGISLRSVILLDADAEDGSSGALTSTDLRLTPDARAELSK